MVHIPTRSCSSRHAEHTSICRRPGVVQIAVIGAGVRATQRVVWTEHVPTMTTPDGSTLMTFSFIAVTIVRQFKPFDQPVTGILHQVLPVLPRQDPMEDGMDARFGFVEQHVR